VLQPHSIELQMAAELGVGGVVALLVFASGVLGAGFARRGTLAAQDRFIRVAALGMFTAWFVDTSVDWLYDIPGLTGMAMLAAGLLVVPAVQVRRRRSLAVGGRLLFVGGLAALALLAASVGRQYAAGRYLTDGTGQIASSPQKAIGTLRTAAQLDPYSLNVLYGLAAAYARQNDYRQARNALLVASGREPHNYVPPALLGDLAMRRADYRLAAREYARAAQLDPRDPQLAQSERSAQAAGG
jgi:tetratricopeptide (TPR) repeat protein